MGRRLLLPVTCALAAGAFGAGAALAAAGGQGTVTMTTHDDNVVVSMPVTSPCRARRAR